MDNATRSERSRRAILEAALTIIARDGAGRLTLDAIVRESGISKGGLTHHFPSKEAVLRALLEGQIEHFEAFSLAWREKAGPEVAYPMLAADIAATQEAVDRSCSTAFALVAAAAQDPELLATIRDRAGERLGRLRAEARDPTVATLRWMAARGLVSSFLLGTCPLSEEEMRGLFAMLKDDAAWERFAGRGVDERVAGDPAGSPAGPHQAARVG